MLGGPTCCLETGTALKISNVVSPMPAGSTERMMGETRIGFCLEALSRHVCSPGGADMTVVERLFSELRALGFRHGYRPKVTENLTHFLCNNTPFF